MENYIILHGSFGSKDGNWFPYAGHINSESGYDTFEGIINYL